jgi:hypothetical protein
MKKFKIKCTQEFKYLDVTKQGRTFPLQAWVGPEVSKKLKFKDFLTKAQDGGKVVSHKNRLHLPPEKLLVLILLEDDSTQGT